MYGPADPEAEAFAAFRREVPEIASGAVVIRALARDPGVRTKVVVDSDDPDVDFMRACSGGLQKVSAALGGESVHVTTWSPFPEIMVQHALSPVRVSRVQLDEHWHRAWVTISQNQTAGVLATLEGQRQLASRLSGWVIEIVVDSELP